jgi:hypothetical protein
MRTGMDHLPAHIGDTRYHSFFAHWQTRHRRLTCRRLCPAPRSSPQPQTPRVTNNARSRWANRAFKSRSLDRTPASRMDDAQHLRRTRQRSKSDWEIPRARHKSCASRSPRNPPGTPSVPSYKVHEHFHRLSLVSPTHKDHRTRPPERIRRT